MKNSVSKLTPSERINSEIKGCQERYFSEMAYWGKMKQTLLRSEPNATDSFNVLVYKLYFNTWSIALVVKWLIEHGFRAKGSTEAGRQYNNNDISNIIKNVDIEDIDLQNAAREILSNNKTYIDRKHN